MNRSGNRGTLWVGLALASSMLSASCALAPASAEEAASVASDTPSGEHVESTSEPLVGGWVVGPLGVGTLRPVATHVCMLTMIQGDLSGPSSFARVLQSGDNWVLHTSSSAIKAAAHCFPRDQFHGNNTGTVIGAEVTATATATAPATAQAPALGGDAFSFLSGVQGPMNIADRAVVSQSGALTLGSLVESQPSTAGQSLTAFGRAFEVHTAAPHLARFVRTDGIHGDLSAVPPYQLPAAANVTSVDMAPTSQAMCGFTTIKGRLRSASEFVEIRASVASGVERWELRTNNIPGARGAARCFARDQNL